MIHRCTEVRRTLELTVPIAKWVKNTKSISKLDIFKLSALTSTFYSSYNGRQITTYYFKTVIKAFVPRCKIGTDWMMKPIIEITVRLTVP